MNKRVADRDIGNAIERGAAGKKSGVFYKFGNKVKRFFHSYNKGKKKYLKN